MGDLKRSLKRSSNSSPDPEQIHYEILCHLPIETLHILLDIINETLMPSVLHVLSVSIV